MRPMLNFMLCLAVVACVLVSCSEQSAVVGKWIGDEQNSLEFTRDGQMHWQMGILRISGTYKVISPTKLRIHFSEKDTGTPKAQEDVQIAVTSDHLTLTEPNNRSFKYTRQK